MRVRHRHLKHARRTRAISTWKSVLPATRFSPASRSWSIRQAGWSVSAASMPSPMRASPTPPRLLQPGKALVSATEASVRGGLCCVGFDEKSLHEEELGQSAREQHAGLGSGAGLGGDRRGAGGSGYCAGADGRGDRHGVSPLYPQCQRLWSGQGERRRPPPGGNTDQQPAVGLRVDHDRVHFGGRPVAHAGIEAQAVSVLRRGRTPHLRPALRLRSGDPGRGGKDCRRCGL